MELRLKGFGTIEITDATRVEGDDILVKSANGFREIAEIADYEIKSVYLVKVNNKWGLIAWLDVPENSLEEEYITAIVENQADIYRLKALL